MHPPSRQPRRSRRARRFRRWFFAGTVVLLAGLGFGVSGRDEAALRSFTGAVDRWQDHPEFRAVAIDYAVRGSEAMRSRPFFVRASGLIIAVRSVPGLPKQYAVNPTSRLHYENFSRGPLSAYLHLCDEQSVPDFIGIVEGLGRRAAPTDAELRTLLDAFRMDFPVAKDAGAVRSVAALLGDADAGRPFTVRTNVTKPLAPHVAALAQSLGLPPDPADMTPAEQQAVLDRLDGYLRRHDVELWRTKQVNDFCGGVWAQVFSPPYNELLLPALALSNVAQILLFLLLATAIARYGSRRRSIRRAARRRRLQPEGAV